MCYTRKYKNLLNIFYEVNGVSGTHTKQGGGKRVISIPHFLVFAPPLFGGFLNSCKILSFKVKKKTENDNQVNNRLLYASYATILYCLIKPGCMGDKQNTEKNKKKT